MELNDKAQTLCLQSVATDKIITELMRRNIYGLLWQPGNGVIMCTEMPEGAKRLQKVLED